MPVKKTTTSKTTVSKKIVKKDTVETGFSVDVVNTEGKIVEKLPLSQAVFGVKPNAQLMAQAVRVYLANQRGGNASTKTRGQVQGSTRKIYRQKGTGKARHGALRAPIFVHGGIAHGPHPVDYSLKMSQKMRQKALLCALSAKMQENALKVIDGISKVEPKTKKMATVFGNVGLSDKKRRILFITPYQKKEEGEKVLRAVRNLSGIEYLSARQLNTYEVLKSKTLVFMKEAIPVVEQVFGGKKS